jgi:hypothetical protein
LPCSWNAETFLFCVWEKKWCTCYFHFTDGEIKSPCGFTADIFFLTAKFHHHVVQQFKVFGLQLGKKVAFLLQNISVHFTSMTSWFFDQQNDVAECWNLKIIWTKNQNQKGSRRWALKSIKFSKSWI